MTVAQTSHPLEEEGVKSFAEAAQFALDQFQSINTVSKEIWFLQPEECLRTFGFTKRQALVFKGKRTPISEEPARSRSGRKRTRPENLNQCVTGKPKGQSNDPEYWDSEVKDVKQLVAIAKFKEGATGIAAEFAQDIAWKGCDDESEGNAPFEFAVIHPMLRTWQSTTDAFEKLAKTKGMNDDFISVLHTDLKTEKDLLKARGLNIEGGDSAYGVEGTHFRDGEGAVGGTVGDQMDTSTCRFRLRLSKLNCTASGD